VDLQGDVAQGFHRAAVGLVDHARMVDFDEDAWIHLTVSGIATLVKKAGLNTSLQSTFFGRPM